MSYLGDKFDMNGTTEAQKIRTQEGYKHSTTGHQRTAQTDLLYFFCLYCFSFLWGEGCCYSMVYIYNICYLLSV